MHAPPCEVGIGSTGEYTAAQKAKQHTHPLENPIPAGSNTVGNLWETFE
jgi:hypothetical protein